MMNYPAKVTRLDLGLQFNPSDESEVENARDEEYVTLWGGRREAVARSIIVNGSAGGEIANASAGRPSDKEAIEQVGELDRLPEFTTSTQVADGFGTNSTIVCIKIKKKFLTKGSVTEYGWVCYPSAPVQFLAWCDGRRYVYN